MSAAESAVARWYDDKTSSILAKYGPGPRVHFHVGLVTESVRRRAAACQQPDILRDVIVASQERTVEHAAQRWDADGWRGARLLDVGCGLGGGVIFWASEYDCRVDAITIASRHLPLVRAFADEAGVADRIEVRLQDAATIDSSPGRYRAVVALDSSCYLDRAAWFTRLHDVVEPGGVVCIEDAFAEPGDAARLFDRYWTTAIGTVDSYVHAAASAGFELVEWDDLTEATVRFWDLSMAWSALVRRQCHDPQTIRRLGRSLGFQGRLRRYWQSREVRYGLLRFRRLPQ